MRTKLALLLFAMSLTGCAKHVASSQPPPPDINKDWAVTISFTYDFTNFMQCSATVTTGCITGFQWGYLSGPSNVQTQLKTSPVSVCSGAQPQSCTDTVNAQLPIGNVTPYVVAAYIDNAGKAGTSLAGLATADAIQAGVPGGVSWTRK